MPSWKKSTSPKNGCNKVARSRCQNVATVFETTAFETLDSARVGENGGRLHISINPASGRERSNLREHVRVRHRHARRLALQRRENGCNKVARSRGQNVATVLETPFLK